MNENILDKQCDLCGDMVTQTTPIQTKELEENLMFKDFPTLDKNKKKIEVCLSCAEIIEDTKDNTTGRILSWFL